MIRSPRRQPKEPFSGPVVTPMLQSAADAPARGPGALAPLGARNLPERIADRIVEAVGRRHLLPGQRLIETELAEQLQVSRIPLRETLRILQSQGFVEAIPRRGVRLIAFDAAWAARLYDIRIALERLACHATAKRMRHELGVRTRFDAALSDLVRAARSGDIYAQSEADMALHTLIYQLSDVPLLQTLWSAIARHILVLFTVEGQHALAGEQLIAQHEEFRRVLLEGSPEQIDRIVADHVHSNPPRSQSQAGQPSRRRGRS